MSETGERLQIPERLHSLLDADGPLILHKGAVNRPCGGCDSKKKWTRRVSNAEGQFTNLCIECLRRLDDAGKLEEQPQ